ncbi:hypothetical protein ACFLYO_03835 [Chloroflexota bacterium]
MTTSDLGPTPATPEPTDITPRQYRWGLALAYGIHLIIVALYIFSIIPQKYHPPEHLFWLHNGGDNQGYYDLAHDISALDFSTPNKYPLGLPILILPFVALFPAYPMMQLTQVVAAFWSLIMFPVGQWSLGKLGQQTTGRRWLALLAVSLWTLLPLIFWAGLRIGASPIVAETGSVHLIWAQMLSDGPTALCTMLLVIVYLKLREEPTRWRWAILAGVLAGLLPMIRITAALIVPVIGVLLLLERHWRALLTMGVGAIIVYLPQLAYNTHFYGNPFTTGYTALDTLPPAGLFSFSYLGFGTRLLWDTLGLLLPLALIGIGIGTFYGLRYLWRVNRWGALVIAGWITSYVAVYSIYYYSWDSALLRFWIPMYPAAVIVVVAVVGQIAANRQT